MHLVEDSPVYRSKTANVTITETPKLPLIVKLDSKKTKMEKPCSEVPGKWLEDSKMHSSKSCLLFALKEHSADRSVVFTNGSLNA